MSPRKPIVDDEDDVDDQDGTVDQDAHRSSDLKLNVRRADEVALGGAPTPVEDAAADEREER